MSIKMRDVRSVKTRKSKNGLIKPLLLVSFLVPFIFFLSCDNLWVTGILPRPDEPLPKPGIITGTYQIGERITVVMPTRSSSEAYQYQWYLDGVPIIGANSPDFLLVAETLGKEVTCVVTNVFITNKYEQDYSDVELEPDMVLEAPPPSGGTSGGGNGKVRIYQWRVNGEDIPGANGDTYTVTDDDVDKEITLVIIEGDPVGDPIVVEVETPPSGNKTVPYAIKFTATGAVLGDALSLSPSGGQEDEVIRIYYTVVNADALNRLFLSVAGQSLGDVAAAGSGYKTYTVAVSHAVDGVITLLAEFMHGSDALLEGAVIDSSWTGSPKGKTDKSISVNEAPALQDSDQVVEYAIFDEHGDQIGGWQTSPDFTGLDPNTKYYIWARSKANGTHAAGPAVKGQEITTDRSKGAKMVSTIRVGSRTPHSITVDSLPPSSETGQVVEYAIYDENGNQIGDWTEDHVFDGLQPGKTYYIRARYKGNNVYEPGEYMESGPFTTPGSEGKAVDNKPTAAGPATEDTITVNPVTITDNPGNQDVEYAISTDPNADPEDLEWQDGTTFDDLDPNKPYYVYVRSKHNNNYGSGEPKVSDPIYTDKGTRAFVAPGPYNITYGATLGAISLPAGYTWIAAGTSPNAGNGQTFPAEYLDPSGDYYLASGSITVNVAKATSTINWPTGLTATYGQTLSAVSGMPVDNGSGTPGTFSWTSGGTTSVGNAGSQSHNLTFIPSSANYSGATQDVTVTVNKAAGAGVSGTLTVNTKTHNSLNMNSAVLLTSPTGQAIEYAYGTSSLSPTSAWQSTSNFSSLTPNTPYYVFARSASSSNYETGTPSPVGGPFTTFALQAFSFPLDPIVNNALTLPWSVSNNDDLEFSEASGPIIELTFTGSYDAIEWLVDGVSAASAINTFTLNDHITKFDSGILTIRVEIGSIWYARSVQVIVNP